MVGEEEHSSDEEALSHAENSSQLLSLAAINSSFPTSLNCAANGNSKRYNLVVCQEFSVAFQFLPTLHRRSPAVINHPNKRRKVLPPVTGPWSATETLGLCKLVDMSGGRLVNADVSFLLSAISR